MSIKCPRGFVSVPHGDLIICVTPDYYQVRGVRVPVDLREAHEIAAQHDAILPTPTMVDSIWQHADVRLPPRPLNPANTGDPRFYNNIADPRWVEVHNAIVEDQLKEANAESGALIAGHKKDIVAQSRTSQRIAIYGWHQSNGRPIQSRSTVHSWNYKDYSQGLRLVSTTAFTADGDQIQLSY